MKNSRIKKVCIGILIVGAVVGLVIGIFLTCLIAGGKFKDIKKESTGVQSKLQKQNDELQKKLQKYDAGTAVPSKENTEDGWALTLVNESMPLDTAYAPELIAIQEGQQNVDARISQDLEQMLTDAQAEGLSMYIGSSYRSYEDQKQVFNTTMQQWIDQGQGYIDAYNETKKSVAVPGSSEHALGLALDMVSASYQELDEKQADTAETKWLIANCYKYGFILRYPPAKADITGIIYEPWHYRYVGKEAAKEITEKDITLEEYLGLAE